MTWALAAAAVSLWQGNRLWRGAVYLAAGSTALALVFPPTPAPAPMLPTAGVWNGGYSSAPADVPQVLAPGPAPQAPAPATVPAYGAAPVAPSMPAPAGPVQIGKPSVPAGGADLLGPPASEDPTYRPPSVNVIQPRRPLKDGGAE